ncbi:MAG: HAD hydrolase-like protein [Luteitalea sp.]|nr:HAD hydrolase-like protein [Luteitalea sp.]
MMANKWITFDCFGTLVDWRTGFATILRPLAGERTDALITAYHELERQLEQERPHRLYRDVLETGLARAAARIGLRLTGAQAEALSAGWDRQPVFADVEPALSNLRAAGWKLAVLTNCDVDLFDLTQGSFQQPFDLVVTAEQVKDYKPSLAHFLYFWRASGVKRRDWVHVACSWYHDIQPSREMDVRRIWVDRDRTGDDPTAATLRLEDVRALPEAVESVTTAKP